MEEQTVTLPIRKPLSREMAADARAIFAAALAAADPQKAIERLCRIENETLYLGPQVYNLRHITGILLIGAGKATAVMARAIERILGERIRAGLISVKYGHALPLKRIATIEAGHPLPDSNGLNAARRILSMVEQAGAQELVILLLSGGGSALLPLPAGRLTLADKQAVSRRLLSCGAAIHEINTVRKHLSAIKGGRLARAAYPAQIAALILSDVVGDDLDVIASGPTVPDNSTFADCRRILTYYGVWEQLPTAVQDHLSAGVAGIIEETPKAEAPPWEHVQNIIIGNNRSALQAARATAAALGYRPLLLSTRIQGETRTVAQVHAAIAQEILTSRDPIAPPACLLSGGETTVTIKGDGHGGRNLEFTLAAALAIAGQPHVVVLSAGTDGTDGPTDAAGALADHTTCQRAAEAGLESRRHLDNNDAYPFFERLGDLLKTGPTQTNVMDLHIFLIKKGT